MYIPKSGIAGSLLFSNFLRNCRTDIQRGCTSLHSHQQCRRVPFTPHLLQHKLSLVFLILVILTGIRWNLRVVLICISLMTKDVEHFLKCLLIIFDSCAESSLLRSVPRFSIGLFLLLVTNYFSSLYILEINPLSDISMTISQKIKKQPSSRPSNTTFGYISKGCSVMPQGHVLNYVHSSFVCHSQNLETT